MRGYKKSYYHKIPCSLLQGASFKVYLTGVESKGYSSGVGQPALVRSALRSGPGNDRTGACPVAPADGTGVKCLAT